HDGRALTIARRAEYSPERVRGIRQEIRDTYFAGDANVRVVRDVRRMVIFGRSNLLSDAPISHVDLLVCRNVLIYFDSVAQEHIMRHLRYALNEGGVLFLGKAESQLKRNSAFVAIEPRWRIFQRRSSQGTIGWHGISGGINMESEAKDKAEQELQSLKLNFDTVLSTLESGVLLMDASDTVISENEKILKLWEISNKMQGQQLQNTELWQRCPELKQHLEESKKGQASVHFDCYASPSTLLSITVKPIQSSTPDSPQLGTLIYMENVTPRATLHSTIEELETTAEELQSTNEELETTNEELQSTNEELSSRTRQLDEVNARYSEMMERMPWPVFLVDQQGLIYMFNSAARKLFGFAEPSERGMRLEELPMDNRSRQNMMRRHRSAMEMQKQSTLRDLHLVTNRFDGTTDVHFTPLSRDSGRHSVIVMFEVQPSKKKTGSRNNSNTSGKKSPSE